jgi:hypothetical protein
MVGEWRAHPAEGRGTGGRPQTPHGRGLERSGMRNFAYSDGAATGGCADGSAIARLGRDGQVNGGGGDGLRDGQV